MIEFDAFVLLLASTYYWTVGEFIAFAIGYFFVQGKLGGVVKTITKCVLIIIIVFEYSCAMKSHFRKSGNQMSGKWKSSYASLLA